MKRLHVHITERRTGLILGAAFQHLVSGPQDLDFCEAPGYYENGDKQEKPDILYIYSRGGATTWTSRIRIRLQRLISLYKSRACASRNTLPIRRQRVYYGHIVKKDHHVTTVVVSLRTSIGATVKTSGKPEGHGSLARTFTGTKIQSLHPFMCPS